MWLTDLLLVIYQRRRAQTEDVQILGDAALPDFWLERLADKP